MAVEIKTGRIRGYEEICIFENQRYRPLFGWGSKGFLFPKERSMYSDESGEVSFAVSKLDEIPAPPGYEWATGWKIDLKSDSVDSEGWCYARTFAKLSENLSSGKSANVPRPGHVVRRRMWTRYARRIRPSVTSFGRDEPKSEDQHPQGLFPFSSISTTESGSAPLKHSDIVMAIIYENERIENLPNGPSWSIQHLRDDGVDWPPFSDVTGKYELPSPATVKVKWGYHWSDDWECVVIRNITDVEGWIYGSSFHEIGLALNSAQIGSESIEKCCRTRKWQRKMVASPLVRNTPVMTPYELCISINEVGGLSGLDGIVKVEVAVEDVIAGITGGRSTKAAAPGTLSGSVALRTTDVTNAARLLWTTQNQFSIPLTSLENHNLSLTIYYETEREKPTVIGVARNDSALGELLWSQVNRKFEIGLPVSSEPAAQRNYSTPYILIQLQLLERSPLALSPLPDLLPSTMLHQLREDRGPITLFVETLSGQLRKSMIVPDQCLSIANYIISQMNLIYPGGSHRSPLLLVSKTHLEDICADYFSLASLPLGFRFERKLYPFAINSTVVTPLSRQLLQLEYLSESDFNTSLSLLTKSDESHTLYFSSRKSLVVFLRILLRAQTSRSVSSDQFSLLHRYLDETAVQSSLLFTTVDEQLVLSLTHSTSPRKTYSVPVEDITQVTPSTFLPLSCPLEVTLEIFNFLSPDIRSSSTAMVSVLTMSGQYRSTIFSCDSTARDHGTIRFFSSFDDIKNESVLLSLHIQEDSSKEYQTLGEVVLPLSRVVFSEHERFPVGVPRFERFQLQPPRYALMLSIIQAFQLLPMNLDRTSDPYCIIRFVDEDCQPVSSSNQSGFRTKHVLKTLNPVWNQQLVFHGDSGFTLATYIHIEVWDRDVVTADTCMGEVFVPLCRVSSNSLRLSLRLNWSPLMPSQYRKNPQHFGTLELDVRSIGSQDEQYSDSRYSRYFHRNAQLGVLEVNSFTSLLSAASSTWMTQPLETEKDSRYVNTYGCSIKRNHPGLILFPCSMKFEEYSSRDLKAKETKEKVSKSIFDFSKNKKAFSTDSGSEIPRTKKKANVSSFLDTCLENSTSGHLCIPWNQIVDVMAITSSTVVLTCYIHRCIVSGGTSSYHKIPIDLVIGPCPADSVLQQVKDTMELFPLKEKLFNLFDKSLPSPSPNILCSILKDLSQQLVVSRLDFQRLQSEARIPRDEDFPYSESSKQDTLRKYKEFTIEIDSSVDIAALESWTSVLCHQIHILLLVARMSCSCSANSPCWKDDIYQVVENRCEMAGFPLFSGVSNEKSGSSDLSQVLALIELTEETLLEMILFNWSYLHPDHSWFAHLKSTVSPKLLDACCDEVVASRHSLPRISWMLQAAINAFYNRIISFIGKSIDRKRFEKLEGNQSRLDLIAFVITEDDRISTVLQELLLLVGLNVSPSPFLSLTLNIEGLLDRFASILTFELKKYLNQALISCRGPDIMPPWEVRVVDKSVYVGPLPELIFEIFQTFLGMATSPDSYPNSSQFSRLKLLNMNKVIIHSVLASYDLLREEFDQIFSNMAKIFVDGKFSAMEQDKMNEVILQNISVLCSIANDCDRLTTIHIPKLLKESVMALTVNDDGSDVWMASQTYLHDLNAHVSDLQLEIKRIAWTAVESLTRIIFTDLKDLYLNRFEEILNTPVDNFPIFTSILRTLEDYLTDLRSNLLPEYFRMLVLSCCHKVLHRYFQKLYDHSRGILRTESAMQFPLISAGAVKLGSILKSVAVEKKTWHLTTTLTQTQCLTVRHDLVNLLNLFGRVLDHSFHRAVICNQFQQLGVFLDCLDYTPSQSEFFQALDLLSTLCSHREEPLLAVAVLKGIDPQIVRDFRGTRDTPPLVIDWNNAALVYTFCEEEIGSDTADQKRGANLFQLSNPRSGHSENLAALMGLEGPHFKGLNDLKLISRYYSAGSATIHEGNEKYTLLVSQLQCRGLIASHHFRLGRSLVYVRLIHLTEQQQTKLVTSNVAPAWPDTLTFTSKMADLQSNGILLEVIEYNWLIKRNFEIASCRIDIPRITPQSPPIDEWFHLEKFDRRSRAWSEHLFPIAAGVKHAAEALEDVALKFDPFQISSLDDENSSTTASASAPLDLMIHVHISFSPTS